MKYALFVHLGIVATCVLHAATYEFDADNPLEQYGDEIAVSYASGSIASMTVTPSGDGNVILRGDALPFASGAKIVINPCDGCDFIVRNAIAAVDELMVTQCTRTVTWSGAKLPTTSSATPPTKVFENLDLSAVSIASAVLDVQGTGHPHFVERTEDGALTAQMQIYSEGSTLLKATKIRLMQQGADIVAAYDWSRYTAKQSPAPDFETLTQIPSGTPTKDQYRDNTYSATAITLIVNAHSTVRLEGTIVGVLRIGGGQRVVVAADALDNWSSRLVGTDGQVVFEGGEVRSGPQSVEILADAIVTPNTWKVFAANQRLADLSVVSARMAGESLSKTPVDAYIQGWKNDGAAASCWVQYQADAAAAKPGTLKCVKVEFRQNGSDVEINATSAKYVSQPASEPYFRYGTDMETAEGAKPGSLATSITTGGYCVTDLRTEFSRAAPTQTVHLPGGCEFPDGTLTVTGFVAVVAAEAKTLPGGSVEVMNGASLFISHNDQSTSVGTWNTGYQVAPGGCLRLMAYSLRRTQPLSIDGGILEIAPGSSSVTDVGLYLSDLTLRNGAVVTGAKLRLGNSSSETIVTVGGSSPSVIKSGLVLVGQSLTSGDPCTVRFNVEDVSSDGSADLVLEGGIGEFSTTRAPVRVVKDGAGLLHVAGAANYGSITPTDVLVVGKAKQKLLRFGMSKDALTDAQLENIRLASKPTLKPRLDANGYVDFSTGLCLTVR